jgi:hypothetical protein
MIFSLRGAPGKIATRRSFVLPVGWLQGVPSSSTGLPATTTSMTPRSFATCCTGRSIRAMRWSPSSTVSKWRRRPTGSSTWASKAATRWLRKARPRRSPAIRELHRPVSKAGAGAEGQGRAPRGGVGSGDRPGRLLESRRKPILAASLESGQSEPCKAKDEHRPDRQFGDGRCLGAVHGRGRRRRRS